MNIVCSTDICPIILNSKCIFYEGDDLIYTGIVTNDNLETALIKINTALQAAGIGYVFQNGVTNIGGNIVEFGGSLLHNTYITGNFTLSFAGNLEGASLITTGGLSTQFVKGDGSLDSTSYQPIGNYITALTGDGTASGPGSSVFTLAIVNSAPGTYGDANNIPVITVNNKGLATFITSIPANFPSDIINLVGDVYGSGVTGGTITMTLQTVNPNVYATNTFLKFAVNGKGLVKSAAPITNLDLDGVYGFHPVTDDRILTINGVSQNLKNNRSWTVSGTGHIIQDEGIDLPARTHLNFVGAGVTATDDVGNNATVITIPGGGGSAAWGSIGAGTGVGSQIDLVTYLSSNYYPFSSNPAGYLTSASLQDLTISTGLQLNFGSTYNTSLAKTLSIDNTVVTLTGAQALSNKTGLISQWTNDNAYITLLSLSATSPITYNNSTGVISTTMTSGKLIGRYSALSGVFEEITISTGLSLDGSGNLTAIGSGGTVTSVSGTLNRITSTGGTTPIIDIDVNYIGQASITTLGTITTGTWNAAKIAEGYGGTNQSTYLTGDTLYASAANTLSKLGIGTSAQLYIVNSGIPSWQTMSGEATISNTGAITLTNSAVIGKVLTGYVSGAGTVSATDSILSAIQKLNGNTAALVTGVSSVTGTVNQITASPTTGAVVLSLTSNVAFPGTWTIGTLGYSDTGILWSAQSSTNSYNQVIVQNTNSGSSASTNFVVSNNSGTASTKYGEFGMNSSGFSGSGSWNIANGVYLDTISDDLAIGTLANKTLHFFTNSATTDNLSITGAGVFAFTVPVNGSSYTSTWTATANTQSAFEWAGIVTARNTTSDTLRYLVIDPTLISAAATQTLTAVLLNPTFTDVNSATKYIFRAQNATSDRLTIGYDGAMIITSGNSSTNPTLTLVGIGSGTNYTARFFQSGGSSETFSIKDNGVVSFFNWTLPSATTINGTSTNTLKAVFNTLNTTQVDGAGLYLQNSTAASLAQNQISPSITFEGTGWRTSITAASQVGKMAIDLLPVNGSSTITAQLRFQSSMNGAAYSTVAYIDSNGTFSTSAAGGSQLAINFSAISSTTGFGRNSSNQGVILVLPTGQGFGIGPIIGTTIQARLDVNNTGALPPLRIADVTFASNAAESNRYFFGGAVQGFQSGTYANQRFTYFTTVGLQRQTAGQTPVFTRAANIAIQGAPTIADAFATGTNTIGLEIETAAVSAQWTNSFGLVVNAMTGATNNYAAYFNGTVGINTAAPTASLHLTQNAQSSAWINALTITLGAHTALTASTEFSNIVVSTVTQQWATGTLTTQRFNWIKSPTIGFVGASTATDVYNLYIDAPTQGANATITNKWAMGLNGHLKMVDGFNIATGTGTGMQLGTAAGQKVSLWGVTPVIQPALTGVTTAGFTANTSANILYAESTFTGNTGATAYSVSDIIKNLKNAGILAA